MMNSVALEIQTKRGRISESRMRNAAFYKVPDFKETHEGMNWRKSKQLLDVAIADRIWTAGA